MCLIEYLRIEYSNISKILSLFLLLILSTTYSEFEHTNSYRLIRYQQLYKRRRESLFYCTGAIALQIQTEY